MDLKAWLKTRSGAIWTAAALTLIVLGESIFPPWAPYFIIYAGLAIALPLWLKTPRFGPPFRIFKEFWPAILVFFIVLLVWDQAIAGWLYEYALKQLGLGGDRFWSVAAAIDRVAEAAAGKFGFSKDAALGLYGLFIIVWAPFGEELFYRGYLQETLRREKKWGHQALLVPAALFGLRHATHFFFLWPAVPLGAALAWAFTAFVSGLLFAVLYEGTRSLWPPVILHLLGNLAALLL